MTSHFVGLDLGPPGEPTGLGVLQRPVVDIRDPACDRRPVYTLAHLQRFHVGVSFPEIVDDVRNLLRTPPLSGAVLAVDRTAVGGSVMRLFQDGLQSQVTCRFVPVVVATIGIDSGFVPGVGWAVGRAELVSTLQVLLQTHRLVIPKTLPEADTLVREMAQFRARPVTVSADPLTAWRDGQHDDLLLALGLAAWMGEKALPGLRELQPDDRPIRYFV